MPAWRRQQRYFCLSDTSCGSSGQVASSRSSRHAALCALASLVAFAVAVPLPHTHQFCKSKRQGQGQCSTATMPLGAQHQAEPSNLARRAKDRKRQKRAPPTPGCFSAGPLMVSCVCSGISWCKLASVGARARVMLNECVAGEACLSPKRHACPPPMVQAVALLLP